MLKIQSIASGSQGNCTYIASDTTHILVDIGLSLREVTSRLRSVDINPETITAILITHEHNDHIHGVANFAKKMGATIYMPKGFGHLVDAPSTSFDDTFQIGDITVSFCPVPHDSKFCYSYAFTKDDSKVALATDLGKATPQLLDHLSGSQVVLLECNFDIVKLQNNVKYPMMLKRRIMGGTGHLSNTAASLAIYELAKSGVDQIILAHLSQKNNSPNLAFNTVVDFLRTKGIIEGKDIAIDVASQDRPGRAFIIS